MNTVTTRHEPGPVLTGIPGPVLDAEAREILLHPAVGGVVLFSRNYEDRAQLRHLVEGIRALRDPRLLVCIDQEGGRVQRLKRGFTSLPPLGALGRLNDSDPVKALDMAYRHGRVMATEMLACGIDLSFAPVLDLDRGSRVIGDRAFSASPGVVVDLGRSYLAGMHDSGMKATGKHFPGHGSVEADSHLDRAVDTRSLDALRDSDLVPFRKLSAQLDAVMVAHVVYPEVDPRPAGYSKAWLQDLLRGELAFGGVVVSDDLGMQAARTAGDVVERVHACLAAGCDLALVCMPEDVEALLGGECEGLPGAERILAALYGVPTVGREELAIVRAERIREWEHWQHSLEALNRRAGDAPA
jgi:beta-N-acetylhexosaminidase